jgi:addiction module RelB/DinJ family antitoxin
MDRADTTVNVRVDKETKKEIESLFKRLGLNTSVAVNIFFRRCLVEEALPFPVATVANNTRNRKHIPLKERLGNDSSNYVFEEWDTGEPVGREVF